MLRWRVVLERALYKQKSRHTLNRDRIEVSVTFIGLIKGYFSRLK